MSDGPTQEDVDRVLNKMLKDGRVITCGCEEPHYYLSDDAGIKAYEKNKRLGKCK